MHFSFGILYDECIERHAPAPRILYYRVRAVFTLFGNLIDSKTKKPLFNAAAWKKANQVLKEILEGFYSDPLGANISTCTRLSNQRCLECSSQIAFLLKNAIGTTNALQNGEEQGTP
mmetsp:Transcript_20033/g.28562  ORF Transcript_20033/g.28562 Transcript_20033/m.28562 type:complete len:117 (+) Transcript_20033:286-636(+)